MAKITTTKQEVEITIILSEKEAWWLRNALGGIPHAITGENVEQYARNGLKNLTTIGEDGFLDKLNSAINYEGYGQELYCD